MSINYHQRFAKLMRGIGVVFVDEDLTFSEDVARETSRHAINYLNDSRGNHLNVIRRRRHKHNKRKAGGGFSYKPGISFKRAGNGEFSGLDGHSEEVYRLDEEMSGERYDREFREAQSIPKIEWACLSSRKRNRGFVRSYNTSEEARRLTFRRAEVNECFRKARRVHFFGRSERAGFNSRR